MSIVLTPNQESIIELAIRSGRVRSVDEFIETAVNALPLAKHDFDAKAALAAGDRIRELRRGVMLNRGSISFREMAHFAHKY